MTAHQILETFAVLKPDLGVATVPVNPALYETLDRDFDGFKGHVLVSVHEFSQPWATWERHPAGDEIVLLLSGRATMLLRTADGDESIRLEEPGTYVVVARGIWHTAQTSEPTRMLFITPGEGTENRENPTAAPPNDA
jgi:mannose-6-phosphate isomerase-like protein (cupin superfamily)